MLDVRTRRRLVVLLLLVLLRSALEVVGVASLYPVLALVASPESFMQGTAGVWLAGALGTNNRSVLLISAAAGYAVVGAAAALATAAIFLLQFRFTYALQTDLSVRLLAGYLAKDYEFFFNERTGTLAKNVNVSSAEFSAGLVLYGLFFLTSAVVLLSVVALLVVVSPLPVLGIGAFLAGAFGLVVWRIRKPLARWGVLRDERMGEMFHTAEEALAGIKDVKVSGTERFISQRFRELAAQYAAMNVRFQSASTLPNYMVQALVLGSVAVLLAAVGFLGADVLPHLPLLGVCYVAFSRMLPLGSALYSHWTTVRYYWPALGIVKRALGEARGEAVEPAATEPASPPKNLFSHTLALREVRYRYPGATSDALSRVTLEIPFGAYVAIVGASGAGKSTLLDIILGLLRPTSGILEVDGEELSSSDLAQWRRQIGYVPQHLFLFDATLAENIAIGVPRDRIDPSRLAEVIQMASLGHVVQQLPQGLLTPLGARGQRLSGGERQRVAIARALYRSPRLLVLDEATNALDSATEARINEELAHLKGHTTLVVVSHRLETLRSCDRLHYLARGRVVATGAHAEVSRAIETNQEFTGNGA